jgi:sec-independent protein translocase protein TatA
MIADLPARAPRPVGAGKRCYARRMPGWIGPWELAILLIVVLLVFGPKRLPEMGKSLGKGMREFKNSITGKEDERPQPAELTARAEEEPLPASHRERDTVG